MRDKFGLPFTILDSAALKELRRSHGLQANPFTIHPRMIISLPWLRTPRVQRLLDEVLDSSTHHPAFLDLLVVDEAHHCAPAGILLDTWHSQRQPGGPDPALLATIPGERIGYVQVCDAAPADRREMIEAMSARLLPGDGVVDFGEVVRLLEGIGAHPFVATEIFNPALVSDMGAPAFAHTSIAIARRALDGGGVTNGG